MFAKKKKSRQRPRLPLGVVGGGIIVLEGPSNIVSWYHLHLKSTAICQGNVHFITSRLNLKNGKTSPSHLKSFFGLSNFMKYHKELNVLLVFG